MNWDIKHARYVAASSVIPKAAIKAGFAEHCENAYAGRPALPAILRRLRELDELAVYVDLEA